ncbi:SpoIIE family protein phosphatase [Geodermatophilus sp. DF01_2]|uniref:SpoIIE family protein phosphatase n=1 Tax=Geodermatophilus sp. DF01-2 TaxID=2559610 RepID=UPI001FD83972|nr:SpoIIE family protein phosphatase [Geodermatophilus sp. DF01_2]
MDRPLEPILLDDDEADRLLGELAIDAAGIGTFDWDLVTGELNWDERLLELFGYGSGDFDRTITGFYVRIHPEDLPAVSAALQAAIDECEDFESVYRVRLPDGATRWVSARGRTLCDTEGRAARVLGAAHDVTRQVVGDRGAVAVLEAMPAALYSLDGDWRFTYVNAEAERLLGRPREQLLGRRLWDAVPAAVNSVFEAGCRQAVATGEPITFEAHYPHPLDGWYELRAWPSPDGLSVYLIEVTERRRAQEDARRAAERLAVVAQVSRELSEASTPQLLARRLPDLVAPGLADGCIVSVLDDHGHALAVGSAAADPARRRLLEEYAQARLEALPALPAVVDAFATGEPVVVPGAEAVDLVPAGEARELLTRLAPEWMVGVPLRGRGRSLGLLTLLYAAAERPAPDDIATARDVADRAGLALATARLRDLQRDLAEELQRSLLTAPPQPDHCEIVVRYLPATETAAVGGDWYDAFLQRDGATILVIGDVVGHDSVAAAAMGQLRSLLRGIATSTDAGPAGVLSRLDDSMGLLDVGTLATAVVARLEQAPDELRREVTQLRWSNAGHPPPVVVRADGRVELLTGLRADLLLGVSGDSARHEAVITLERGDTVLLYTDGLVERRGEDLDRGLTRLRAALAELAARPLSQMCDGLLDRLVDPTHTDDVALVAVRLHPDGR